MRRVYLDYNATTPVHPAVLEKMIECLRDVFGNPSSLHRYGQMAHKEVDRARRQVAALIGAEPDEVVFTSGGTEANNFAITGAVSSAKGPLKHVIVSSIEHQSVLNTCRHLEKDGCHVTYIPVDGFGRVNPDDVTRAIRKDTVLISIMLANNEVGTIQPIQDISSLARNDGILFHTDAVQAAGKIPFLIQDLGVDLLSISSHKIFGPKGIGALYVRKGVALTPLIRGGHQEKHRRAGTENVPGIIGFGQAAEIARTSLKEDTERIQSLRAILEKAILDRFEKSRINGHPELRLPNTLSVHFPSIDGETLMMTLDQMGIAVSTASACMTGSGESSHVLIAMGLGAEAAENSIRFSLGRDTTPEDIEYVVHSLGRVV
jgi:cysteine desulfurase